MSAASLGSAGGGVGTSALLAAVVDAERVREEAQTAAFHGQLNHCRHDMDVAATAHAKQLRLLHEQRMEEVLDLRNKVAEQQSLTTTLTERCAAKDATIAALQDAIDKLINHGEAAVLRTEITELTAKIARRVQDAHVIARRCFQTQAALLMSESLADRHHVMAREIGFRAHLALQATGERSNLVISVFRMHMNARDAEHVHSRARLEYDIATLQSQVDESLSEVDRLRISGEQSVRDLETAHAHAAQTKDAEIVQLRAHLAAAEAARAGLELGERATQAALKEMTADRDALALSLASERQRLDAARSELTRVQTERDDAIAGASKRADSLAVSHAADTQRLLATHQSRLGELQAIVADTQLSKASMERALQDALDHAKRVEAAAAAADQLGKSSMASSAATFQTTLIALQAELAQVGAERDAERARVLERDATVESLKKECASMAQHFGDETSKHDAAIAAAITERQMARDAAAASRCDAAECADRCRALDRDVAALRQQVSDATRTEDDAKSVEHEAAGLRAAYMDLQHRLADLEQESLEPRELAQKLSVRTQELDESREQIAILREQLTMVEARCATTEVRLHHQVEEGVATSILLDRGLRKLNASQMGNKEASEVRSTLMQAALVLRRTLEQQGFDVSTLPAAPSSQMDVPFLQQILTQHTELCANHLRKVTSQGGVVASALRTPMVMRSRLD